MAVIQCLKCRSKKRCAQYLYDFTPPISHKGTVERDNQMVPPGTEQSEFTRDVPEIFSETVEVNETELVCQWKNKRKDIRDAGTNRERGTRKQPVFGILYCNGTMWTEVVNDFEAGTLQPLITRQVTLESVVCSDTWRAYTGIAFMVLLIV